MSKAPVKIVLFMLLLCPSVYASVSLGVSPGNLHFSNVLRGGYATRTLTVSTSLEEPLLISLSFEGELADWISLELSSPEFYISRDKPYTVEVILRPPEMAASGNYTGTLHVRTEKLATLGSAAFGSVVKANVAVKLSAEVTGIQSPSCIVGGVAVQDAEPGSPIEVQVNFHNTGNVMLKPEVEVHIWDQMRKVILLSSILEAERVLPTRKQRLSLFIENPLSEGQYWASVRVPACGFYELKTFDIVPKGGISDKGELISVNLPAWARVNELVPIVGVFRNTGARSQEVRLKLEARLGGRVVRLLETEPQIVPAGTTAELRQYFTPKEPGRYEIIGRAYYNKKVSFEKGGILNVRPAEKKAPNYWLIVSYSIILLALLWLLKRIWAAKRGR